MQRRLLSTVLVLGLLTLLIGHNLLLQPTSAQTLTVTVDTTALTFDGDASSVDALLEDPGDDELISFPEALAAVNNTGAGYTINFDLAHGSAIDYNTTYYLVVDNTTLDGDVNGDGIPDVAIDGPDDFFHSLVVLSANNVFRNLVITGLSLDGSGAHGNRVINSYIGPGFDGISPYPNKQVNGMEIENGATNNVIGGTTAGERNIISGNGSSSGILIHSNAHDNQVTGNYIGVGLNGEALPNIVGVYMNNGAFDNIIGGERPSQSCDGPCNVISGNTGSGVIVSTSGSTGNTIKGNYIGINPAGTEAVPQGSGGVRLQNGATGTIVGGERDSEMCNGPCNVLSGNEGGGITITGAGTSDNQVQGNFIGVDPAGTVPISNTLSGVFIQGGASNNLIGGLREFVSDGCEGVCNLIAGNGQAGIAIGEADTNDNRVQGNFIGVGVDGVTDLGNGLSGVVIIDVFGTTAAVHSTAPNRLPSFSTRQSALEQTADLAAPISLQARDLPATGDPGVFVAPEMVPSGEKPTTPGIESVTIIPRPHTPALLGPAPSANVIGGARDGSSFSCAGPCNLIGGNEGDGVTLWGEGIENNLIQGNYIGVELEPNGDQAIPNDFSGVFIGGGASENVVGGEAFNCDTVCNVISGNQSDGVLIYGSGTTTNTVQGNYIGLSPSGNFLVPNAFYGAEIAQGAAANTLGGPRSSAPTICTDGCNLIGGNDIGGIYIHDTGTVSNTVKGNRIGFKDGVDEAPNGIWGVLVAFDANGSEIGGTNEGEGNEVHGGISLYEVSNVPVLGNEVSLPPEYADGRSMPIDLGDDGASCFPWTGGVGPNNAMPPPRILRLSRTLVEGKTQPGATVELFKVVQVGTARGRYFGADVRPITRVEADDTGFFTINLSFGELLSDDLVAVTATDSHGNTSELSQLKRPVIFIHGVGGSWLAGNGGDTLWLPSPFSMNDRLARMALDEFGNSVEAMTVNGTIEFSGYAVYGPVLEWLRDHGYSDESALIERDLYPFAYDWRLGIAPIANDLGDLVDVVASPYYASLAASCEVDLVAHSNGSLVSSLYVQTDSSSQNKVHRLMTYGGPILGTPQAAAAHTSGYLFGVNETFPWSTVTVEWGRMIEMARNLTVAYGLLPSQNYAAASGSSSYLRNLTGSPLLGYTDTFNFMTAAKDAGGLARNGFLWNGEQTNVHNQIDDWRGWRDAPPQVIRVVGQDQPTTVDWGIRYRLLDAEDEIYREPGDTMLHLMYRLGQFAIPGDGDGTVALPSATLGRNAGTDFSGVDESDWIEEFIYYDLPHLELVTDDESLLQMTEILDAGFEVPFNDPFPNSVNNGNPLQSSAGDIPDRDVFYIFSSHPVGIHVTDSMGNHTGPYTPTHTSEIEYSVPDLGYFANSLASTLSFARNDTYTLTILAPVDTTTVQIVRTIPDGSGNNQNVLFLDQSVAMSGSLQLILPAGGAPPAAPFAVDGDGDGLYESTLAPAETLTSTLSGPAIPDPYPWFIRATANVTDTADQQISLTFPDGGGPIWDWQLAAGEGWITPAELSGQTPHTVPIGLATTSLPFGTFSATLTATLSYGNYEVDYRLPVVVDMVSFSLVAVADEATTAEDNAVTIDVLANDNAGQGGPPSLLSVTQPPQGTAVANPDNTVTYTPAADFSGSDSFTYTAGNGSGQTSTATVTVTVTPVNDPPTAVDDTVTTAEDTAVTFEVLVNDGDVDNDPLFVTGVTQPGEGTAVVNGDHSLTYTPNPDFNGPDTLVYTISDNQGGTDTAVVILTVTPVDDPPQPDDDYVYTDEDEGVTFDVLLNDLEPDGDTMTVVSITQPFHGQAFLNPDNTIYYSPTLNFNGEDELIYTVSDDQGNEAGALVFIEVFSVNDPPVAVDDTATTPAGETVEIFVLGNDYDIDGDSITIYDYTWPDNGDISVDYYEGTIYYEPDAGFSGQDTFTYTIIDEEISPSLSGAWALDEHEFLTDTAVVTVTVLPSNNPPAVDAGGPYGVDEGDETTVSASGSDPDGDPLTYAWDLDNDGSFETVGATVPFSAALLDGPSVVTITVQVTDSGGLTGTAQTTVAVLNVAPTVGQIVAPAEPILVHTEITATAVFTDPGVLDTHTAVWDWGDGTVSPGLVAEENGSGSASGSHTYSWPGVYTVELTVLDDDGGAGTAVFRYVVIFDPNGGYVTGGGCIDSPAGAYLDDPALTGAAEFGFIARYMDDVPDLFGKLKFSFPAANLYFVSSQVNWLVLSGHKAYLQGTGTINEGGEYGFLLTVIDGKIVGDETDLFRIQIWEVATGEMIYDTQPGEPRYADPVTALTCGKIVIH